MAEHPDVLIVGAGVLGACAAYFLARARARVTLLEAGAPGGGASGGGFAWINATSKEPRGYHDLNRRGIEAYARLEAELGEAIGLHGGGSLHLAIDAAEQALLRARCEELRDWGYPVTWLDAAGIAELEPGLRLPESGAAAMHATLDLWVEPPRLLAALLAGARARGARIATGRTVTGLLCAGSRVRGVLTAEGPVAAGSVLLAAGTGVPELAAAAGVRVPVERVPGLLAVTRPHGETGPRRVVYGPGLHARPLPGGRSLLAASDLDDQITGGPAMEPPPAAAGTLRERFTRLYPEASGARIERAYLCVRPMPQDGFPIVGTAPTVDGLYLAVTHSGITLGPLLGECIARELLTGERLALLAPYCPDRFASLLG